ncbi:MAG: tRNA glutamyl-Q(34) synthetase GluQRS [Gammaproteobacteria bacterium]|uniref:Glutamyl-Q tRNA(Asp) synthetase n=1 Tax=Candidatus Thiopontia autotrophica TaxID=2841688 RepID=A0A8J6PBH1_9GAMM|nr:tRNA glutamyl-Q(34) synthetase GluQRS [Candidatus Thiopontia autotrophica]MBL6968899.1 tRNA glutamyl-Q(34) synthetase GluQRS [Gammaproteobacteria bacterium]
MNHTNYRGRFAPSPSGDLHFGSLVAATGSYLEAKTNSGEWLVRIEDLDLPRTAHGATDSILATLERHQMQWDHSVIFQSTRNEYYQESLKLLLESDLLFACECSRNQLKGITPYPGSCRNKNLPLENHAIRIRVDDEVITLNDKWQGRHLWNMKKNIGDFIVRRRDGIYAYQLAVVVDDYLQGITHIVRGSDLLESTPRQIYLQQQLDYTTPNYAHLPIAVDNHGIKLSKQHQTQPINRDKPVENIFNALEFLGQNPPNELLTYPLNSVWEWALENWRSNKSLEKPARKSQV